MSKKFLLEVEDPVYYPPWYRPSTLSKKSHSSSNVSDIALWFFNMDVSYAGGVEDLHVGDNSGIEIAN